MITITVTNGQVGNLSLNLAGENGFSGTVNLSCSGLPSGDTCNFSPASVNVSGTTPVMVSVNIATGGAASPTPPPTSSYTAKLHRYSRAAFAGLLPLGFLGFASLRRKLGAVRGSILMVLFMHTAGMMTGCSSGNSAAQMSPPPTSPTAPPPSSPTPATSQITITASSGSLSHDVSVNLTTN